MTYLILAGKMILCSGIMYGYYWLFLRNKKFHYYNRFYLLAAATLSMVIPFIRIPVFFEPGDTTGRMIIQSIDIISVNYWEEEFSEKPAATLNSWFTLQNCLNALYGIGVLILLHMLMRSLFYIRNLSKKYSYENINSLKFYNTSEPGTPFSFFQSIFWNIKLDFNSKEGQQIFRHELFHVKQRHSTDILFLECVKIFFWINPFFHLIKKEMKAIHEFLADQHAVSNNNQYDYAELLILQSISMKKNSVSHYFFQNHIKRRIAMITHFKNKKYSYWARLMVLPLSIILFCAIALYAQNPAATSSIKKETVQDAPHPLPESITVLVDAGHGGNETGAKNDDGLLEKDLSLDIARQIKMHAAAYNINVLMTRDADIFPSMKDRAEMANATKADIVVSVHVNAAPKIRTDKGNYPNPENGFDLYITNKNQKTVEQSKLLGQEISNQISGIYKIGPIKQRKENGIWILDAVPCPAVLIECGFITDEKDVAFITKTENQEKIAKSILEGIVNYKNLEKKFSASFIPSQYW